MNQTQTAGGPSYAAAATTSSAATKGNAAATTTNAEERSAFLLSRRSLRIWPIEGENEKEIMEALVVFCCQALGAPRKDELGIKRVQRVKSAPRGIAFLEVLVEFEDNFARDDILSRGPMLSEYRDTPNKPTAGIRLDIPGHLMGMFKALEAFGFALKRRRDVRREESTASV